MSRPPSPAIQESRLSLWRERLTRFSPTAQSVSEFCRAESISPSSFYGWRAKLLDHDPSLALSAPKKQRQPAPSSFIDLGPVATKPAPLTAKASAAIEIRLDLGHGMMLTIVR